MLDQSRATILVVEEDQQLRKLIGVILDGAGYRVLQVRNRHQAVRLLAGGAGGVDLIVLGGTSRHSTVFDPAAKVLMLSADAANRPENPVLRKPFRPAALIQAVRQLID
jgi:CheY-like chemotaxis protein